MTPGARSAILSSVLIGFGIWLFFSALLLKF